MWYLIMRITFIFILLIEKNPFNGKDKDELISNIEHGKYTFPPLFVKDSSDEIHNKSNNVKSESIRKISAKKEINH